MNTQQFTLTITGGIYPICNRSTSIIIEAEDVTDAYKSCQQWCKTNFPDWNNITHRPNVKRALQPNIYRCNKSSTVSYKKTVYSYSLQKI